MFRMWGKLMKSNRLLKDTVISVENAGLNRTRKVYKALEDICYEFDLPKPLWLEANKKEFMTHDKTRFYHDSFLGGPGYRRRPKPLEYFYRLFLYKLYNTAKSIYNERYREKP